MNKNFMVLSILALCSYIGIVNANTENQADSFNSDSKDPENTAVHNTDLNNVGVAEANDSYSRDSLNTDKISNPKDNNDSKNASSTGLSVDTGIPESNTTEGSIMNSPNTGNSNKNTGGGLFRDDRNNTSHPKNKQNTVPNTQTSR